MIKFDDALLSELLLINGANPSIKDSKGVSALEHAIDKGCYDIARLLIDYDADTNISIKGIPFNKFIEDNPKIKKLLF